MDTKNKEKLEHIQKLFTWKAPLELKNSDGEVIQTVYQRLIGDSDLYRARTIALRFSREMRRALRNTESDEYFAYIDIFNDYTKEEVVTLTLFDELTEIRANVEKDFYFPEPEALESDATTEEQEEHQEQQDTYEDRRAEALDAKIKEALETRQQQLDSLNEGDLRELFIDNKINALCEQELRLKFLSMCVYLGTYLDEKYTYHLFNSFEEFLNSPDTLKAQLVDGYNNLEVSSISLKGFPKVQTSDQSSD